jgi:phospholipase/carboxylesterase
VTTEPARADAVLVLLHARGHSAASMYQLAGRLGLPGIAVVAPEAPGGSWYPLRFNEPRAANEPHLSRALAIAGAALDDVAAAGVPPERVVLGGFSQGACLACDVLARDPRPLGGLAALCGGLIGAVDEELARPAPGALDGLPVLLTGNEQDAWVPVGRVRRTAELLGAAGARVDLRVHPPRPHRVHDDEIEALRALVSRLRAPRG